MTTKIIRPQGEAGKYSPMYLKHKAGILQWKIDNEQKLRDYNREYQRKLRKNPERNEEIRDRAGWRAYIRGVWRNSYRFDSMVGMNRAALMAREGCNTMEEWKEFLKKNESDHIITAKWFRKEENKHLKPYMYRHYNLQFVPRGINRSKHSWIDETDVRIKLIICLLKMDYFMSDPKPTEEHVAKIEELSREITRNRKAVIKKFGSL